MPTGLSLHIGLNRIDPNHYGTDGALNGCVNDARAMREIAASRGFSDTVLLDSAATADAVTRWLREGSRKLVSGDTLLVTYAGHGSQVTDQNNPAEPDGKDETWCLYDRMLVDDELAQAWSGFARGVRIILVSDSCHSATIARALKLLHEIGTSTRDLPGAAELPPIIGLTFGDSDEVTGYRVLPEEFAAYAESNHRELYTDIQRGTAGSENVPIAATIISLTACRDDQTAADGRQHGLFTQTLLETWASGRFSGDYHSFHRQIFDRIRLRQEPNIKIDGVANRTFEGEQPFTANVRTSTSTNNGGTMQQNLSIEERLNALKTGGSRQYAEPSSGTDWCRMELTIPRDLIRGLSDEKVYEFLQTEGCDTLMKAYLTATSVSVSRGVEGSVSCSADTKGNAGCSGSISIRF